MTPRNELSPSTRFVTALLPWLLAIGMLALYVTTLDHQVSLDSLHQIANLNNVAWLAELSRPVSILITYPFRWLPPARIPLAINLFTALCAALSLGLLARSVALLPHDRTQDERERNQNKQAFLVTRHAWLPPVLTVLVCGLQLTFWVNAIAATDEMINLLLFAYVVRCLLEFRISQKQSWLLRFAFVYGLGMANNWAMLLFFPGFLLALVWITGVFDGFTPKFLKHFLKKRRFNLRRAFWLFACWLAGCSLFVLPSLLAAHSTENPVAFWPGLKFAAHNYYAVLTIFSFQTALLLSLTSVLPVIFLSIRWGALLDETNRWDGMAFTSAFYIVDGFFLVICLWVALDPSFSPRQLQPAFPCLPLYFLSALSIGYFSGCFLLLFGARTEKFRRPTRPFIPYLNLASIGLMWLVLFTESSLLVYKNLPEILKRRHDPLAAYFDLLEQTLPPRGAFILSEQSLQLQQLQITLIQHGRQGDYLLVDTSLLRRFPGYFKFLNAAYPEFTATGALANQPAEITGPNITRWLEQLSRTHEIYALHQYSGGLGERFYTEQQGLFFHFQPYSAYVSEAPAPSSTLMAANQAFWQTAQQKQFSQLFERLQPSPANDRWEKFLKKAHIHSQPDNPALLAGEYYSMALNSWGVDLQKAGMLAEASESFGSALPLSSENMPAFMNLECNQALQAHQTLTLDISKRVEDDLGRSRDWDESLRRDGPVDTPSAHYRLGLLCAQAQLIHQAIEHFRRALALVPGSVEPHLRLAEVYLRVGDNTNSLAEAMRALEFPPLQPRALVLQGLALVQMQKFYQAIPPLNQALDLEANNTDAHLARAVAYLNVSKLQAAREDYAEVVRVIPKTYPAYYGLADIAYQMKDTPSLLENCRLYLSNAPPNAPEIGQVQTWLKEMNSTPGR